MSAKLISMESFELDRERLEALLLDLRTRAFRPGQAPYQGMQELGQFIEEVHTALGKSLGFDPGKIHIKDWHNEMAKHGYKCHPARFGPIDVIYGYRNIASHPNEEKHKITSDEVGRRYADISQLVPELISHFPSHNFIDNLLNIQACSLHQRRADDLRLAVAGCGDPDEILPIIREYAFQFTPESKRGFLRAPSDRQLSPIMTALGRLCSSSENDPLAGLAEHLLQYAPSGARLEPIRQWSVAHGSPVMPGDSAPRLRVIRLSIERDPRQAAALLVRQAAIVNPPIPDLDRYVPELPVVLADLEQFYNFMIRTLNGFRLALTRLSNTASATDKPTHWQEFVLDIETPEDLACRDFELAGLNRPGRKLVNQFRCITIRPLFGYEALRPLRGIDRPIFHPKHNKNSVAVWATKAPEILYQAAQGRDCLFTGPMALGCDDGVPPIVQAFEGCPGAIACPSDDEAAALNPLFDGEEERSWPELLDRVTALRLSGNRLKVLWDDPSYDLVLADSL